MARLNSCVAAVVLTCGVASCAITTVGIPLLAEEPGEAHPNCMWRVAPSAVDALMAGVETVVLFTHTSEDSQAPAASTGWLSPQANVPAVVAAIVLFGASAAFGWHEVGECRRELDRARQSLRSTFDSPQPPHAVNGAVPTNLIWIVDAEGGALRSYAFEKTGSLRPGRARWEPGKMESGLRFRPASRAP